ncbi:MAG: FecR domain-containing protein [Bacteroidales bacterium]|jgi:ferric-dicitrate binding protein FerR (iron transport regulator)|nr:FecR domain-containing protein [Bacteroidales bacterium]
MREDLLYKYFRGTATEKEEKEILDWVESSPENEKELKKERLLFDIELFDGKGSGKSNILQGKVFRVIKWGLRVAAVVVVVICCFTLAKDYSYYNHAVMQTFTVPAGDHAELVLADGSRIWLNSRSTLRYPAFFGRRTRDVSLEGEAYFEVAENKKIPFYVHTDYNTIKVVGTHFNVYAYKGSTDFKTTLLQGVVDIYTKGSDKRIARLMKGEYFEAESGKNIVGKTNSLDILKWRDGLYCFYDMPFRNILGRLSKYFGVEIVVEDPEVLDYKCTGKFLQRDGIEHILGVIQKDHKFRFVMNQANNKITITK